jgi:hypothetical protein
MKNLRTFEEFLNEGEINVFDKLGEPLTAMESAIAELLKDADKITDPQWITALKGIQTQCKKLEDTIAKAADRLGIIPIRESLNGEALDENESLASERRAAKALADEFQSAYRDDVRGVWREAKDSFLFILGRLRYTSRAAAQQLADASKASAEEFEEAIITSFFPHLQSENWPLPYTPKWLAAQNAFQDEFLNKD